MRNVRSLAARVPAAAIPAVVAAVVPVVAVVAAAVLAMLWPLAGCAGAGGAPTPSARPTAPAPTVSARAPSAPCSDRPVAYRDWPALEASGEAEWSLDLAAPDGGRLVILGVQHSDDPADPQFAAIDRAWATLRPTTAFYEGPDRPIAGDAAATIAATGESGYVRYLARRDGVPALRLDPDARDEAAHLLARHPRDEVFLFYLLREVARLRDRKGLGPDALRAAVAAMIAKASAMGFDGMFATVDELDAAYRARAGADARWWEVPSWWFSPLPRADERFTHRINRDSSDHRNRHIVAALAAQARTGHRVLAAVGANHVPMIAPALRCELTPPAGR